MLFEIKRAKNGYIVQCDSEEYPNVFQEVSDGEDGWIRHTVIVQFKKGLLEEHEYSSILWDAGNLIKQIPGVREYETSYNDSKFIPEDVTSLGVEIIFENQAALDVFMEHPKHFEANALFEKYLADAPMVLTRRF